MKHLYRKLSVLVLSIVGMGLGNLLCAQNLNVHFDERVELVATVYRIAGIPEYRKCISEEYAKSVDNAFGSYEKTEVAGLARAYYRTGIGYDAVAAYALHLKFTDDKVTPIVFDPKFKNGGDDSFDRWTRKQKTTFLAALNDFYKDSDFHKWYLETKSIREPYLQQEMKTYEVLDLGWYDSFFYPYEKMTKEFIVSLLVGQNNYGLSEMLKDGTFAVNPVFGIWEWSDLAVVIHEFCHPYCNPLIDKYYNDLKEVSVPVFQQNKDVLKEQAYTNAKTMLYETLVRASVICYIQQYLPKIDTESLIEYEKGNGFGLIRPFVEALSDYSSQKSSFPTLESYMPVLVRKISAVL